MTNNSTNPYKIPLDKWSKSKEFCLTHGDIKGYELAQVHCMYLNELYYLWDVYNKNEKLLSEVFEEWMS